VTRNVTPAPSPEELEAVAALRSALRRFAAATDEVTANHALTPRQYDLLAVLHRPGGPDAPSPTQISEELCLSRSATTELLTRAANAGLITRDVDEDNGRVKHVAPTPAGTERFLGALTELRADRARLLGLLQVAAGFAATLVTVA
jgi:DNA-binding MarR family transcriptional regulator